MDEDKAWQSFASSGSVQDYLLYRLAKNHIQEKYFADEPEVKNEVQYKGTDPDIKNAQG